MARPTPEVLSAALSAIREGLGPAVDEFDVYLATMVEATRLPELMGATETARTLAVTTSNLGKVAGLPDPLYAPDHEDPRRRLRAGKFYDGDAIRELARRRREAAGEVVNGRR